MLKTYRVIDNSRQHCFETNENELLAGTHSEPATEKEATVRVIVQPFMYTYEGYNGQTTRTFIIGKCINDRHHLIMFFK
jgi:hypothetical protein